MQKIVVWVTAGLISACATSSPQVSPLAHKTVQIDADLIHPGDADALFLGAGDIANCGLVADAVATGNLIRSLLGKYPEAKVFTVVISLDKTLTEIMKPGMSSQVSIIVGNSGAQLLVPRSAVKFGSEGATVSRVESAEQKRDVAVTILAADGVQYAVAANGALKENDKLLK